MHPIGGGTIPLSVIKPEEVEALEQHVSSLAVSEKTDPVEPFVPAHLAYDKKVLKFIGYFKEDFDRSILTAQSENFRIRFVKIYYYLEVNWTICH